MRVASIFSSNSWQKSELTFFPKCQTIPLRLDRNTVHLWLLSLNRKFADIEAANQRLASALYVSEEEKNSSNPPSQKPETVDQSGSPSRGLQDPDKCSVHTDAGGISKTRSDVSVGSHESEKKQLDSGHLWKRHIKSQPSTCSDRKNNQSKDRQKKSSSSSKGKNIPVRAAYTPPAETYTGYSGYSGYNDYNNYNYNSYQPQPFRGSRGRGGFPRNNFPYGKCFICNQRGHWKNECPIYLGQGSSRHNGDSYN